MIKHVFDFDKTLTFKDSTLLIFRSAYKKRFIKFAEYITLIFLSIITKIKLLKINPYKDIIFFILFRNKNKEYIRNFFIEVSKDKIHSENLNTCGLYIRNESQENVLVISASPTEYIKNLLPNTFVLGTNFSFDKNDIFKGVAVHCHSENKYHELKRNKIKSFDFAYSDSKQDSCLLNLAEKKSFLVLNSKNKRLK